MGQNKANNSWQLEVKDPRKPIGWYPVLKFDEKFYSKYERLASSLKQMDVPFEVRIARDKD